jgi:hypothetical protein
MYVTKHIDWLSGNLPINSDLYSILPAANFKRDGKGMHGFQTRFVDTGSGVVLQADNPGEPEIVLLTFSGDALQNLRRDNSLDEDLRIKRFLLEGGKASRLDLTLNIHEGELTPRKVYSAVQSRQLKARTVTYRFIEGKKGNVSGDTLYMGSPTSDRQFRAYNKSAELGIVDGASWFRLELELRRVRANGAFQSCAINGVAETVNGHLADFIHWSNPEYQSALSGSSVEPLDIPRRDTNRQRWLLGQVAQALAKELMIDYDFRHKFDTSVNGALELLQAEGYNRACKRDQGGSDHAFTN